MAGGAKDADGRETGQQRQQSRRALNSGRVLYFEVSPQNQRFMFDRKPEEARTIRDVT